MLLILIVKFCNLRLYNFWRSSLGSRRKNYETNITRKEYFIHLTKIFQILFKLEEIFFITALKKKEVLIFFIGLIVEIKTDCNIPEKNKNYQKSY